jgi:F0F1-type ATP synthase membrane subunit b/b'
MARRDREINIFNIAFLDVITGAMGAFVLLVVLLSPYVKRGQEVTQQNNNAQQVQQAQQNADEARKERDQAQQQLQQQTEQSAKQALDRAEQNIQQADQAMQTDDVEELKRLLAQARADLADARQQLDRLSQELEQTQQDLKRAEDENETLQQNLNMVKAQVEDLRNRLDAAIQQRDRANNEADEARRQAVAMQDTLDHSEPTPVRWLIVSAQATPGCNNVEFTLDSKTAPLHSVPQMPGFTDAKDILAYLDRGISTIALTPYGTPQTFSIAQPFHQQYVLTVSTADIQTFVGFKANTLPTPGCQLAADFSMDSFTKEGVTGHNWRIVNPIKDTSPILFSLVPPGQSVVPGPGDIATWEKLHQATGVGH